MSAKSFWGGLAISLSVFGSSKMISVNDLPGRPRVVLRGFSDPFVQTILGNETAQKYCKDNRLVKTNESFSKCMLYLIILPAASFCKEPLSDKRYSNEPDSDLKEKCSDIAEMMACALQNEHGFRLSNEKSSFVRRMHCKSKKTAASINAETAQEWNFIILHQVLPKLEMKMKNVTDDTILNSYIEKLGEVQKTRPISSGNTNRNGSRKTFH